MANTVKLKTGSGSDPSASDLILGELAIRTDSGKIFLKKDNGSVAEVSGGGGIDDGDKGDITVSNSGDTWTIDNDAVTYAKIQNVSATDRLLGRDSSGAGVIEEISPSSVRTMLGLAASATTDTTNADNIGSGTLAAARVATLNQDTTGSAATLTTARNIGGVSFDGSANIDLPGVNSGGNQNTSGNAATATALATARTIAGVSFDGSANISLNNNAITNGAGYITATLTEEQVEDYVGGMVTGNTETGITVTYQDSDGTLDFVVASQTDNNFTTTLKNKLDGIAAGATNVTNNNQLTNGASYITSSGTSAACSGNAATATTLATARTIAGVSFDGSANISLNNNAITNGAGYITATLTEEQVEDYVGGMVTGNTETGITVTYQDADGTLDFVVASQTDNNFTTTLKNKLDGIAAGATNVSNTNQLTNGAGFITATLTEEQVEDYVGGMVTGNTETGITVTYQDADGTLDFVVDSQTDNNFTTTLKNKLDGIAASATNVTNNNQLTNGAGYITATLTEEQVEDYVGGMVTGNTETGITVTYQDADGTLDFVVASQTDNNFTNTLKSKLDGIASGATNVTNNNQLTNGAGYLTSASANDGIFWENDQAVSSDYTINNNKNAMSAGPITINSGVTVTVGSGENWTIV